MAGAIQQCQSKSSYPPLVMQDNHHMNPNYVKEDMKDVACLIFSTPCPSKYIFTIYLIHTTQHKLINFLHLNHNCPSDVAFLVYNSMLFMFGGYHQWGHGALPDASVLDLFQLAKTTSCLDKPSPTKLPPMNSGKFQPSAFLVADKIFVLDASLGCEPTACNFELYDPNHNTWSKLPDPCSFDTGCNADAHYVKDDKVFIYIRKKQAVFVLNLGATTSPSWSQLDLCFNLSNNPFGQSTGVIFGSRLVGVYGVYDLGDERCFAQHIGSVVWTDKTPTKSYEVSYECGAKIFRLGCDRVCTIRPAIVYKPRHLKGIKERVKMDGRKSMFVQQSWIRKCKEKRIGSLRMIVNVCRVNANDEGRVNANEEAAAHMEVLESFTVPMFRNNCKLKSFSMPLYPGFDDNYGCIRMVSLCHPQ